YTKTQYNNQCKVGLVSGGFCTALITHGAPTVVTGLVTASGDAPQGRCGRTPLAPQGDSIKKVSSLLLYLTCVSQAYSAYSNVLPVIFSPKNGLDVCLRLDVAYGPYIIVLRLHNPYAITTILTAPLAPLAGAPRALVGGGVS